MKHVLHKLSLLTTAAMFALASFAQGYEYDGINYILDHENKTAAVTYQGTNPEENNYEGEIDIPNKFKYEGTYYRVTSIGEKAFYGCDNIDYINIGPLVTKIGSQAFGNSGMSSLIIPDNDEPMSIADDAFKGSNISLFLLGSYESYSFLNSVSVGTPVFAPEAMLQEIMEAWPGMPKSIEVPYYLEDLSTMTAIAFRLRPAEYYSLPNGPEFEISSVIMSAQGSGIQPDETGLYVCDGIAPETKRDFAINYSIDGMDYGDMLYLTSTKPAIECEGISNTTTSFTATVVAQEEGAYVVVEKGVSVNGKKYPADENGKVEVTNLSEDKEYTVKPYATYKTKTYYGTEFVITTNSSTGVADVVASSEPSVALSNNTRSGYLEVLVSCEGEAAYYIVNITGQKEKEGTLMGENKPNTISTAELSSGIYLINVNGNNINKTMKFVIK